MTSRIIDKAKEVFNEETINVNEDVHSLIVVKEAEVNKYMDGLNVRKARRSRGNKINIGAYISGQEAGDKVQINKAVGA